MYCRDPYFSIVWIVGPLEIIRNRLLQFNCWFGLSEVVVTIFLLSCHSSTIFWIVLAPDASTLTTSLRTAVAPIDVVPALGLVHLSCFRRVFEPWGFFGFLTLIPFRFLRVVSTLFIVFIFITMIISFPNFQAFAGAISISLAKRSTSPQCW